MYVYLYYEKNELINSVRIKILLIQSKFRGEHETDF